MSTGHGHEILCERGRVEAPPKRNDVSFISVHKNKLYDKPLYG